MLRADWNPSVEELNSLPITHPAGMFEASVPGYFDALKLAAQPSSSGFLSWAKANQTTVFVLAGALAVLAFLKGSRR